MYRMTLILRLGVARGNLGGEGGDIVLEVLVVVDLIDGVSKTRALVVHRSDGHAVGNKQLLAEGGWAYVSPQPDT